MEASLKATRLLIDHKVSSCVSVMALLSIYVCVSAALMYSDAALVLALALKASHRAWRCQLAVIG